MKGIVLCAGRGSRLQALTDDRPKCMVHYKSRPILEYTIEAMRQCGLKEIVVVGGYKSERINSSGVKLLLNPRYLETNMVYSLFCAQSEFDQDIVISYGDIIYSPAVLRSLLACTAPIAAVIDREWRSLWEKRMSDPLADAETLKLDGQLRILELGNKPSSYADIEGQYIGLIKFSAAICGKIREFYAALDRSARYDGQSFDNMYMTTFLQLIIDRLHAVQAVPVEGGWLEFDAPSDLALEAAWMRTG